MDFAPQLPQHYFSFIYLRCFFFRLLCKAAWTCATTRRDAPALCTTFGTTPGCVTSRAPCARKRTTFLACTLTTKRNKRSIDNYESVCFSSWKRKTNKSMLERTTDASFSVVPCRCKERLYLSLCDVSCLSVLGRTHQPPPKHDFWAAQAILSNFHFIF